MRVLRHVLVLILASALVASPATWRPCTALQLATAAAAVVEHASHLTSQNANAIGHGGHDHTAMHAHAAEDPAPAAADHGGMKCCAMCTMATAVPPAMDTVVIFTVSTRLFFPDHEWSSGNTVAVDPGIPKRIV